MRRVEREPSCSRPTFRQRLTRRTGSASGGTGAAAPTLGPAAPGPGRLLALRCAAHDPPSSHADHLEAASCTPGFGAPSHETAPASDTSPPAPALGGVAPVRLRDPPGATQSSVSAPPAAPELS